MSRLPDLFTSRGMLAALAAGVALAGAACTRDDRDRDLQPPADFLAPPIFQPTVGDGGAPPRLGFGPGFSPVEADEDGRTWRWMGARGEIRLANDARRPHVLRLRGWVPLELLEAPPTVRLSIDGHPLETFVATDRTLVRTYRVPAEALGAGPTATLVLETSATGRAPNDARSLGLSIELVGWK